MMDEERSIHRNKMIITIAILVLVFTVVAVILINSTPNDTLYFHRVHNGNTGEPLGIVTSLFLYALLWWIAGLVPSACVFLFMLFLYFALHRKDKRMMSCSYHPKHEEEYFFGGWVSFISTYVAVFVLMVLHISNAITLPL